MKPIKIFKPWTAYALVFFLAVLIALVVFIGWQIPIEVWPKLLESEKFKLLLIYLMIFIAAIMLMATYHIQISETQLSRHLLLGKICFQRINFDDIKSIDVLIHLPAARHFHKTEARILEITTRQHTRIKIPLMLFKNADQLLDTLHQYVEFDQTPIRPHLPAIATHDIGQRVLYLLGLAILLAAGSMIFNHFHLTSLHFGNEPYFYALLLIPLLWVPCFLIIKAERKAYPLLTSTIGAAVLATGSYFSMIQFNRYYTEQQSQLAIQTFKLLHADEQHQEWIMVDSSIQSETNHDDNLYIYKKWGDGFNPMLKAGQTYNIPIQQGHLNDVAFSARSFHQARPVSNK